LIGAILETGTNNSQRPKGWRNKNDFTRYDKNI